MMHPLSRQDQELFSLMWENLLARLAGVREGSKRGLISALVCAQASSRLCQ